jgi:hypothetical protein
VPETAEPKVEQPKIMFGLPQEPEAPEPKSEEKPRDTSGRFLDKATAKLHELAREAGVPEDEISSSSADELRNAVRLSQIEQSLQKRWEPAPQSPPAPADDKFEGEEEIAPQIVKILKNLRDENKALREEISNTERKRSAESFAQRADRAFADLGEAYADHVGKGSRDDLEPDEVEMRQVLIKRAARLAGKNATEAQILKKVKAAAEGLFGKKQAPAGRYTPEEWNGAGLASPTHRDDGMEEKPTNRAEAEAAIAAYLARTGKR